MKFVGVYEAAAMLGMKKPNFLRLTKNPLFPAPYQRLRMGPIWDIEMIKIWRAARRREGK